MIDFRNEGVHKCHDGSNEIEDAELPEKIWTMVRGVQLRVWAIGVEAIAVGIHLKGI
jgi:hypothetical protein